jgi:methylated-DNA-[protein]-cysteine S-methyltransferase
MRIKRSTNPEVFLSTLESPVGTLYLTFAKGALTGIDFTPPKEPLPKGETPAAAIREFHEYFEKGMDSFSQPISLDGAGPFDRSVWLGLREIPYGETRTYKWLAEKIGKPGATRAVGQALGRNTLPILLPCHRIIESDGSLGGYSGGVDIKRKLLRIEYYKSLEKGTSEPSVEENLGERERI